MMDALLVVIQMEERMMLMEGARLMRVDWVVRI